MHRLKDFYFLLHCSVSFILFFRIDVICFNNDYSQRLQAKIIKLVDVSYGGENGFNQAIELAAESLQNVKFIQEKKLIGNILFDYFEIEINLKYLFKIAHDIKSN